MTRPDTWMPFYVGDYLRDTGALSTLEHGAYVLLILHAWTHGGMLPGDEGRLRQLARMTVKEWGRSRDTLLGFFTRIGDTYRHKRVDRELTVAHSKIEQRRAAGIASGKKRIFQTISNEINEKNERALNERSLLVDLPLQRNAVPSPSPKKEEKKDISLREIVPSSDANADFERFWKLYPRKVGKKDARVLFEKASRRVSPDVIVDGLIRYPFQDEAKYQPHPATWLNDERWEAEPDTPPPTVVKRRESNGNAAAELAELLNYDLRVRVEDYAKTQGGPNERTHNPANDHILAYEAGPANGRRENAAFEDADRPLRDGPRK